MIDRLSPEQRSQLTECVKVTVAGDCYLQLGIFPKAVLSGPNQYEKRSDFQEGWNAAVFETIDSVDKQLKMVDTGDENLWFLILSQLGSFANDRFILNMNDTFGYAESYGCEVKPEEYREVATLVMSYGFWGAAYWVMKKEGLNGSSIPECDEALQFVKNRVEKKK